LQILHLDFYIIIFGSAPFLIIIIFFLGSSTFWFGSRSSFYSSAFLSVSVVNGLSCGFYLSTIWNSESLVWICFLFYSYEIAIFSPWSVLWSEPNIDFYSNFFIIGMSSWSNVIVSWTESLTDYMPFILEA